MLNRIPLWRHVIVGFVIVAMSLLAGFRLIGAGTDSAIRPEQFDAKQVTVVPDGADGLRIREVVDIDFGVEARRGYQRIIRNDFGVPTDVIAESPDANAEVNVVDSGTETRIRIGNPDVTFTGRHRYILEYTLADAGVSTGQFLLDVIGNDETLETGRFEVVLTGFDDLRTSCDTGAYGAFGGCEFVLDESGNGVAVIEPLAPGDGITVGARFAGLDTASMPRLPDPPDPLPTGFQPLGVLMIPLGVAAAALVFLLGRSYGSNTVLAGGAADAAFGDLPVPGRAARPADTATYRVPDSRLAELATIEFVPPRGLEPWQAAAVLREAVDDETVAAWFAEMIATDALTISDDGEMQLRRGPDTARLSAVDQGHLQRLFGSSEVVELGSYDPGFTATWGAIKAEQRSFVGAAGWWSRGGPGGRVTTPTRVVGLLIVALLVVAFVVFVVTVAGTNFWLAVSSLWLALIAGFLVPFVVAAAMYRPMFPARTATGSALALRSESFRRFLAASEGKHVEWAWEHGLLREYSAWAVALGAADAWTAAIRSSNIADPQIALAGPLLVHSAASSFHSSHTAPSSSGGGGGGGGGVGGGGGGGSSGSW